ncbi:hypothetical protein INS49_010576 [Diaporthe citri]|uniref:uncharacterized protein n=1 Tax=Diaporthe citri TaxID=83186 RepID=UPI001C7EDBD7|nr:uncharacterized protein INS49_010576 [Diaporthe citri]KAG6362346.1 hypothetical protein INS49_010576 [Diaporthe citri]
MPKGRPDDVTSSLRKLTLNPQAAAPGKPKPKLDDGIEALLEKVTAKAKPFVVRYPTLKKKPKSKTSGVLAPAQPKTKVPVNVGPAPAKSMSKAPVAALSSASRSGDKYKSAPIKD